MKNSNSGILLSLSPLYFLSLFITLTLSSCPQSLQGLTGNIIGPQNPNFPLAILEADQGVPAGIPCVVVFCNSTFDVMNAIQYAVNNKIIPSVRSGRHSYMAYSVLNNSIVIDISELNETTYLGDNVIRFGAGVRLIEAYNFASKYNLIFPGGTCPNVGLSGFVLGGGYGFWARKYGLAIDSLISIDIVLPNGKLISANQTQFSDLFWACRGGGNGNFGIVTSLTFNLPQISATQPLTKYVIDWTGDFQSDIIDGWQNWLQTVPDELNPNLVIYHTSISSSGVFIGNQSELLPIIAPLLKIGIVKDINITSMSLRDIIINTSGCDNFTQCLEEGREEITPTDHGFKGKSRYVDSSLSLLGIQTLLSYAQGDKYRNCSGCGFTGVMIDSYGGKINSYPRNWTAFPHRTMKYHLQPLIYWKNNTYYGEPATDWIRDFYNNLVEYLSPYAYINYIDGDLPNWGFAYYAENFPQLMKIKSIYDPNNLFTFPQSIPLPALFLDS